MSENTKSYQTLTPKLALLLAAPHTWIASIAPVLLGAALAFHPTLSSSFGTHTFTSQSSWYSNIVLFVALLAICVLLQSSVNVLNDYFDFAKGTDTVENQPDPNDAILVYNNINPRHALLLACGFIFVAFALGIYVIYRAGWIPLLIALIGVLAIFTYSGGKHPVSYLPLGEIVSGLTMGGLITFACFYSFTHSFDLHILLYALPVILGIALIMATNNTCDIEKDKAAHRKTFAVKVGRKRAVLTYRTSLMLWLLAVLLIPLFFFNAGALVAVVAVLLSIPTVKKLTKNQLTPKSRKDAFSCVTLLNKLLGLGYIAAICLDTLVMTL